MYIVQNSKYKYNISQALNIVKLEFTISVSSALQDEAFLNKLHMKPHLSKLKTLKKTSGYF